jgi:hypothetical protein
MEIASSTTDLRTLMRIIFLVRDRVEFRSGPLYGSPIEDR